MDPCIGWYQPEQQGPARDLWARIIWVAQQVDNMNVNDRHSEANNATPDYISLNGESIKSNSTNTSSTNANTTNNRYYNPTKRKRENLASTYDFNENQKYLIGQYGGCPWRRRQGKYDTAIVG